jgi:hypothetical protein
MTDQPYLQLKFPELPPNTTLVFEEQIFFQRWLVQGLNERWTNREVDRTTLPYMTTSVNDFIAMVFRHYYDLGTNFTLQGQRLRGFQATFEPTIQSFRLDPMVERGPMTIEVKELVPNETT